MDNSEPSRNQTQLEDATPGDDEAAREPIPKLLIAPIAILIASLLIGLPLLRILTANGDDESQRTQAAINAREQVALLFASALLESRSTRIAERYAAAEVHPRVNELIADLRRRDSSELAGAVATTERVTCPAPATGQECFRSRLARPGQDAVVDIRFTVGIVNGVARVVAVEYDRASLLR